MDNSDSYLLKVELKSGYLHATVMGKNTKENVVGYLMEILRACGQQKCSKVLIEENFRGASLLTRNMFDIVYTKSKDAARAGLKIAYIDVNKEHNVNLLQYGEIVARHRGLDMKIFSNVVEAERWLITSTGESDSEIR